MSLQDKNFTENDDEGDSGTGGGQAGQICFVDFLSSADKERDDLLSPEEKRHLQAIHQELNKQQIKQQKELRAERQAAKENKTTRQFSYGQGGGGGEVSPYKKNPVLDCAQFSGATDKKVSPSPSENEANTNPEQRAEAELQHQLQNQPQYTSQPSFNPKPRTPGG